MEYGNKMSKIITIGLGLSVCFTFFPLSFGKTLGLVMYVILALSTLICTFILKGFSRPKCIVLCLSTFPIVLYWFFALSHLPGFGIFIFIMVLPILSFIIVVSNIDEMKAELGVLLIFAIDAIAIILY